MTTATTWRPPQRLSAARKARLAAEILLAYARVRWTLARGDLRSTVEKLRSTRGKRADAARMGQSTYQEGLRLGWAVTRTLSKLPSDSRCLMQSLVLTRLLSERGIDSSLVIAVKPEPEFEAHAFVEHQGDALLTPGSDDYRRLFEI